MNTEIIIDTLKNASIEMLRLVGEVARLKQENELLTKVAENAAMLDGKPTMERSLMTASAYWLEELETALSAWRKWKGQI